MADYDHRWECNIDTGAASLHVTACGSGSPALVFLHYWGGSSRTWQPVIDRLATMSRCIAIDQRGWGRSTGPETGYAIEDLAGDAAAVIAQLALEDYILIGHSMGGKVAQLLTTRGLEGLRGVVLVAPAPARPAEIPDEVRAQMALAYTSRESVLATLDRVLSHAALTDELREQVVADSLGGSPGAKREWPASAIVEDVSADLARIDVPVLVVAADHDQVEPVELMQSNVVGLIGGARLEVIAGSGHLIPLERPAELSDLIAEFRDSTMTGYQSPASCAAERLHHSSRPGE